MAASDTVFFVGGAGAGLAAFHYMGKEKQADRNIGYGLAAVGLISLATAITRAKKAEGAPPAPEALPEPEEGPVPSKFQPQEPATLKPSVNVPYQTFPTSIVVTLTPESRDQLTILADCSVIAVPLPWVEETAPAIFEYAWGNGERNPDALTNEILQQSLGDCYGQETDAIVELRNLVKQRVVNEITEREGPFEAQLDVGE